VGCSNSESVSAGTTLLLSTSCAIGQVAVATEIRVQSTDQSGFDLCLADDDTTLSCYTAGSTTSSASCFNAASGTSIGGRAQKIVLRITCGNVFSPCPLKYDVSLACRTSPTPAPTNQPTFAPPPTNALTFPRVPGFYLSVFNNPRCSVSGSACSCTCCLGNLCTASYQGTISGSCGQASCATAYPNACPASGAPGSNSVSSVRNGILATKNGRSGSCVSSDSVSNGNGFVVLCSAASPNSPWTISAYSTSSCTGSQNKVYAGTGAGCAELDGLGVEVTCALSSASTSSLLIVLLTTFVYMIVFG